MSEGIAEYMQKGRNMFRLGFAGLLDLPFKPAKNARRHSKCTKVGAFFYCTIHVMDFVGGIN